MELAKSFAIIAVIAIIVAAVVPNAFTVLSASTGSWWPTAYPATSSGWGSYQQMVQTSVNPNTYGPYPTNYAPYTSPAPAPAQSTVVEYSPAPVPSYTQQVAYSTPVASYPNGSGWWATGYPTQQDRAAQWSNYLAMIQNSVNPYPNPYVQCNAGRYQWTGYEWRMVC